MQIILDIAEIVKEIAESDILINNRYEALVRRSNEIKQKVIQYRFEGIENIKLVRVNAYSHLSIKNRK